MGEKAMRAWLILLAALGQVTASLPAAISLDEAASSTSVADFDSYLEAQVEQFTDGAKVESPQARPARPAPKAMSVSALLREEARKEAARVKRNSLTAKATELREAKAEKREISDVESVAASKTPQQLTDAQLESEVLALAGEKKSPEALSSSSKRDEARLDMAAQDAASKFSKSARLVKSLIGGSNKRRLQAHVEALDVGAEAAKSLTVARGNAERLLNELNQMAVKQGRAARAEKENYDAAEKKVGSSKKQYGDAVVEVQSAGRAVQSKLRLLRDAINLSSGSTDAKVNKARLALQLAQDRLQQASRMESKSQPVLAAALKKQRAAELKLQLRQMDAKGNQAAASVLAIPLKITPHTWATTHEETVAEKAQRLMKLREAAAAREAALPGN